jgi:outer membrane protein TolC
MISAMQKWLILILSFCLLPVAAQNQAHNLNYYLSQGFSNSPLLKEYRNQIDQATADSLLARASKMPLVEARSQLQYFPVYKNFGYDEAITNGGNYTAVMGVSQNIFNRKAMDNTYKSIDIQKQSLNISAAISSRELRKLITDQYLTAYSFYRDLEFNKTFLRFSLEENEIVSRFVRNGVFKQTDYLSLLVETQSQQMLVNQLEVLYRRETGNLDRLCGLNDTTRYDLEEPDISIRGVPEISMTPQLIQFRIDSIRIENEKSAIDIRYHPKISWFADAGFMTANPWNFYNHFGYSAGLNLSIPVYDGRQKNIEKQKLQLSENSRQVYEDNYRKQYARQIRQLYEELKILGETASGFSQQLATSDQLVKALKEQLEMGNIVMTEYVNAIKNYKNINRNLILINLQKLQVINELNFLMNE